MRLLFQLVHRAMNSAARYKIMFATDWPVFRNQLDEKEWVEVFTRDAKQYGFEFTPEELKLLFAENVQDYLDLNL